MPHGTTVVIVYMERNDRRSTPIRLISVPEQHLLPCLLPFPLLVLLGGRPMARLSLSGLISAGGLRVRAKVSACPGSQRRPPLLARRMHSPLSQPPFRPARPAPAAC